MSKEHADSAEALSSEASERLATEKSDALAASKSDVTAFDTRFASATKSLKLQANDFDAMQEAANEAEQGHTEAIGEAITALCEASDATSSIVTTYVQMDMVADVPTGLTPEVRAPG